MAYCLDGSKGGPEGTCYQLTSQQDPAAGYIAYHGFPNTNVICGLELSEAEAEFVTQIALWMHGGFLTREGRIAQTNEAEGYAAGYLWAPFADATSEVRWACVALLDSAHAFRDSGANGPERDYAIIYVPTDGNDRQRILLSPRVGAMALRKTSTSDEVTGANACYSLEGAVYGVYLNDDCTATATTVSGEAAAIVTDAGGYGMIEGLLPGTYYVRETTPPCGYESDQTTYAVPIAPNETSTVNGGRVEDVPLVSKGGALVRKVDRDTAAVSLDLSHHPEGDATLSGAQIQVRHFANLAGDTSGSAERTWTFVTDDSGCVNFDADHLVSGDPPYRDGDGSFVMPLGTYTVQEITPPRGYALSDPTVHRMIVSQDRQSVSVVHPEWNCPSADEGFAGRGIEDAPRRGGVSIQKDDAQFAGQPQGDASLAGISFDLVNRSANAVVVEGRLYEVGEHIAGYLVTDEKGLASTAPDLLPVGTYEIVEAQANDSMTHSPVTQVVSITPEGAGTWTKPARPFSNEVKRGGLKVQKDDAETSFPRPLGAATLEGTVFAVTNESEHAVSIAGHTYPAGSEIPEARMTTDAEGRAQTPSDLLPYGTYRVRESVPPNGYLPTRSESDRGSQVVHVREQGVLYEQPEGHTENQVIRADIAFKKKEEGSMRPMGGVAFEVSSLTTGEAHVIVTDENGMADTSASWVAHTFQTNGNDLALEGKVSADDLKANRGIWFSGRAGETTRADDTLGALPFDTYEIKEIRSKANEGHELISFEATITRDGVKLDLGTVSDSMMPNVQTIARGAEGDKRVVAGQESIIVDTVHYANVIPGRRYHVHATLRDGKTGEAICGESGDEVSGSESFVSTERHGTVDVSLSLDSTQLGERDLVVFESLEDDEGNEVSMHGDLCNTDQTVRVVPSIRTHADNGTDGEKEIASTGRALVRDTVTYSGLEPGMEYRLVATLHDRVTGAAVTTKDGGAVQAEKKFVAASACGDEGVELEFESKDCAGRELVVFERLYQGERELAVHQDTGDEAQTVRVARIGTHASNAPDGRREAPATGITTIWDTVDYENLTPGATYKLTATLFDKEANSTLKDQDGNEVRVTREFTCVTPSGSETVEVALAGGLAEGKELVAFETLARDDRPIAEHHDAEDEGQTVRFPQLSTVAHGAETESKCLPGHGCVWVADDVTYAGLVPGREYRLVGEMHDRQTGEVLLSLDGSPSRAEVRFTPEQSAGTERVLLEVDGSRLQGRSAVAFETLWSNDDIVAEHADANDESQTVAFASIVTRAHDASDGDKELEPRDARIVDVVEYTNLEPGVEHVLEATLFDKETGEAVRGKDGKVLSASSSFVPDASSGSVEMELAFDASQWAGHELVAFERLTRDHEVVATHEDLNDQAQSVRVTNRNGSPALPQTGAGVASAVAIATGAGLILASCHRGSGRKARRAPVRNRRR